VGLGLTQRALEHLAGLLVELLEPRAGVAARLAGVDLQLLELLHERLPLGVQAGHRCPPCALLGWIMR